MKKLWRESAMKTMGKDLTPKLSKLSASKDMAQLDSLFDEALAVDKQYVHLGLDSCSDGQRPGFELLQARVGLLLTDAIKKGNVTEILKFDRQFQLLGSVEENGGSKAWDKVIEITSKELKAAQKEVKQLLAPMQKVKGGPKPTNIRCDDATVQHALDVELAADRQLGLMTGGNGGTDQTQAVNDAMFFKGSCTK